MLASVWRVYQCNWKYNFFSWSDTHTSITNIFMFLVCAKVLLLAKISLQLKSKIIHTILSKFSLTTVWLRQQFNVLRTTCKSFKYPANCYNCGFAMIVAACSCDVSSKQQRLLTVSSWQMASRENKFKSAGNVELLISKKWKLREEGRAYSMAKWLQGRMAGMLCSRKSTYLCNSHYISYSLYIVKYVNRHTHIDTRSHPLMHTCIRNKLNSVCCVFYRLSWHLNNVSTFGILLYHQAFCWCACQSHPSHPGWERQQQCEHLELSWWN